MEAKPIPGRPTKLSGEQMSWLAGAAPRRTPQQYEIVFALWSLRLIGELNRPRLRILLSRSAVVPNGQFRFMVHEDSTAAQVFVASLKRIVRDAKRSMFPIVDGRAIHNAKMANDYVAAQQRRLTLLFRPPYSPYFNPDEHAWGNARAPVAKRGVTSKADLKARMRGALRRLQKLTEITTGFFRHPHCRFTAEGGIANRHYLRGA